MVFSHITSSPPSPLPIREPYCPSGPTFCLSGSSTGSRYFMPLSPRGDPVPSIEIQRDGNVLGVDDAGSRGPGDISASARAGVDYIRLGGWNPRSGRFVHHAQAQVIENLVPTPEVQVSTYPRGWAEDGNGGACGSTITSVLGQSSEDGQGTIRASYDRPPPTLFLVDLSPNYANRLGGLEVGQGVHEVTMAGGPRSSDNAYASRPPTYNPGWERLPKYSPVTPGSGRAYRAFAANDDNETRYLLASNPEMGFAWTGWTQLDRDDTQQDRNGNRRNGWTDNGSMWLNVCLILSSVAVWSLVIISLKIQDGSNYPIGGGAGGGMGRTPSPWSGM